MKTLQWHETAHIAPAIGQVVLGWWDASSIHTIVRRSKTQWNAPGCWISEKRIEPLFWLELPDPPLSPIPEDHAA